VIRKISCGNFPGRETVFLCILGLGGGGAVITPLYGLSELCADPKGMFCELFMSEKGVNFDHIELK